MHHLVQNGQLKILGPLVSVLLSLLDSKDPPKTDWMSLSHIYVHLYIII